jgi:P-type E1-E2 ATPase
MIMVSIPGFGKLQLRHLALDYNGTLAQDGELLPGVPDLLRSLAKEFQIHVVTADTFGVAAERLAGLPVKLKILPAESQAEAKAAFVKKLGRKSVAAIGNGRNDRKMLKIAALGIAVIQQEGAAAQALTAADIVARDIQSALGLFSNVNRLKATLRS